MRVCVSFLKKITCIAVVFLAGTENKSVTSPTRVASFSSQADDASAPRPSSQSHNAHTSNLKLTPHLDIDTDSDSACPSEREEDRESSGGEEEGEEEEGEESEREEEKILGEDEGAERRTDEKKKRRRRKKKELEEEEEAKEEEEDSSVK
jgi:hypothetical protein